MSQAQARVVLKEGIAAARNGNKVQARQLFQQAAELDPAIETTWLWLAGLAESPREAVQFLERVLVLNPDHEKANTALRTARVQTGIAAAKAGDKAQARLLLHQAVELDPANEIAWLWLASVAETGEQAVHFLKKVLEINPANERAQAGLERYRGQHVPPPAEHTPPRPHEPETPAAEQEIDADIAVEVDNLGECPFCQVKKTTPERCPRCGAILSLDHPEDFFRPLEVDRQKISESIERLEQTDWTQDLSRSWQLGLAYLNLKHFDVALERFQTAVQLQGTDSDVAARVMALVEYRADLQRREAARNQRKTILVVDDSPTVRKLVTMTVERRGFTTRTAADGYEAIDVIRDRGVPDLILLDIAMPGMDGYQLCKLLRQHADTTNIPIVMLSGKDGFFNKMRGRMAGATEYITKPFEPEGLLRVVEHYCVPQEPADSRQQ